MDKERGFDMGFAEYLTKPIKVDLVKSALDQAIANN